MRYANRIPYDERGVLYVGSIEAARQDSTEQFDRVITVCQDRVDDNISDNCQYHWYNMADGEAVPEYGGECSYEILRNAADKLHDALDSDEEVLIHCHRGRSRSVSTSIAALGRLLDTDYRRAHTIVVNGRPQASPKKQMLDYAERYIEER